MWDVPFDYHIWKSNYWNVEVNGNIQVNADRNRYRALRKSPGDPTRGEDQWRQFTTGNFHVKGCMSSNSNSKLTIIVNYNNNQ